MMPASRKQSRLLLLLCLLLAAACGKPKEIYLYDRGDDESGVYELVLPMDTLCNYDISLYTRLEGTDSTLYSTRIIPLDIAVQSPSGQRYREGFDFVVYSESKLWSYMGRRDIQVPYRTGITVRQSGEWKMTIRLADRDDAHIVKGMGACLRRNK